MNAGQTRPDHHHVVAVTGGGSGIAVTGGGSGIGLAVAEYLLGAGHKVVLLDRNVEALDAQVERLREGTDQVTGVGCDVSDSGSVGAAFDAVHARHGRLDGLVRRGSP